MKIHNISKLNDFMAVLYKCKGGVWLFTPEGDRYNLKSKFNQYLALELLLMERGEFLELECSDKEDEALFLEYLNEHPEFKDW